MLLNWSAFPVNWKKIKEAESGTAYTQYWRNEKAKGGTAEDRRPAEDWAWPKRRLQSQSFPNLELLALMLFKLCQPEHQNKIVANSMAATLQRLNCNTIQNLDPLCWRSVSITMTSSDSSYFKTALKIFLCLSPLLWNKKVFIYVKHLPDWKFPKETGMCFVQLGIFLIQSCWRPLNNP